MSELIEKLKQKREEKIRKAKEREAKKKAKESEKAAKKKKKPKLTYRERYNMKRRSERLRKKRQNRQNWRRRQAFLEEKRKAGDVRGYFMVLITKNRKRVKNLGHSFWSLKSYERYNTALAENRETVKFPLEYTTLSDKRQKAGEVPKKVEYEILLVSKIPEGENNVSSFRDDDGKLVEHYFVDHSDYLILKRDVWLIEETFSVYGYHPTRDRKTYDFILDMVAGDADENTKRIMRYNNKLLVIKDDNDIDFVSCKTPEQCVALYDRLSDDVASPNVFFQGKVGAEIVSWVMNLIEEKTGWTRQTIKRNFVL